MTTDELLAAICDRGYDVRMAHNKQWRVWVEIDTHSIHYVYGTELADVLQRLLDRLSGKRTKDTD